MGFFGSLWISASLAAEVVTAKELTSLCEVLRLKQSRPNEMRALRPEDRTYEVEINDFDFVVKQRVCYKKRN